MAQGSYPSFPSTLLGLQTLTLWSLRQPQTLFLQCILGSPSHPTIRNHVYPIEFRDSVGTKETAVSR